jgi:hypothetical protein
MPAPPRSEKKGKPGFLRRLLARALDRADPETKRYQDLLLNVSLFAAVVFSMCVLGALSPQHPLLPTPSI